MVDQKADWEAEYKLVIKPSSRTSRYKKIYPFTPLTLLNYIKQVVYVNK